MMLEGSLEAQMDTAQKNGYTTPEDYKVLGPHPQEAHFGFNGVVRARDHFDSGTNEEHTAR
jgi:hypothetical protein